MGTKEIKSDTNHGYRIFTFAKLNLTLQIFKPLKESGYHPIRSIFQTISLYDTLEVGCDYNKKGCWITSDHNNVPLDERNILVQVYQAFEKELPYGVTIHIKKEIPMGGGLGGGSSNAAALIGFLNQQTLQLPGKILEEKASRIGSDVPFFLKGGAALVEGIGEKITPIPCDKETYYVIIWPNLIVSTKDIYDAYDQVTAHWPTGENYNRSTSIQVKPGKNDFKELVFQKYRVLQEIEDWLRQYEQKVYLTGTGGTLFFPVKTEQDGKKWHDMILAKYPNIFTRVVKTISEGYSISEEEEILNQHVY